MAQSDLLSIPLVHKALLLVDEILLELLLSDLLEFHLALNLPLNALLLLCFALVAGFLLVVVSLKKRLVLLFLAIDSIYSLPVLCLLLRALLAG